MASWPETVRNEPEYVEGNETILLTLDNTCDDSVVPHKAAELALLLADFLKGITPDSDGEAMAESYVACELLGLLAPSACRAIPALEHCIRLDGSKEDLVRWLRLMAAEARWRITGDPTAALSVGTELLNDPEWWLVGHAADLLGELGPAAKPAIANLRGLLGHEHQSARRHVRAAIERVTTPFTRRPTEC
jgi:hypothetical protein